MTFVLNCCPYLLIFLSVVTCKTRKERQKDGIKATLPSSNKYKPTLRCRLLVFLGRHIDKTKNVYRILFDTTSNDKFVFAPTWNGVRFNRNKVCVSDRVPLLGWLYGNLNFFRDTTCEGDAYRQRCWAWQCRWAPLCPSLSLYTLPMLEPTRNLQRKRIIMLVRQTDSESLLAVWRCWEYE